MLPSHAAPKRLAIYVDGANLDKASANRGIRIKYDRLKNFLSGSRKVVKACYYNSKSTKKGDIAFYKRVREAKFDVILGPYSIPSRKQKQVDVQIAVDMVADAKDAAYEIALLASGDGDLTPAVRKVVAIGKLVEIAAFNHSSTITTLSRELSANASRTIDLTKNVAKFT